MTVIELIRLLADESPDDRVEIRFREDGGTGAARGLCDLVAKVSRGGYRAVALIGDMDGPAIDATSHYPESDCRPNRSKRRSRKKARTKKRAKGRKP